MTNQVTNQSHARGGETNQVTNQRKMLRCTVRVCTVYRYTVLEAAELAPASRATLEDLIALHPPRFVPLNCERRLQLKKDIERARAKHGWKKLDFKVLVHSGGGVEKPGGWRFSPLVLYDLGGTLATADRRGDRPGCSKVRRACCNGWLGKQWHGPRLLTRVRS